MLFRIATSLSPLPLPLLVDCGSLRRRQERGRPRLARGLYVLATLTQLLMCCICFTTFVFLGFFVFVLYMYLLCVQANRYLDTMDFIYTFNHFYCWLGFLAFVSIINRLAS
jgi:hypothetical protein